MGAQGSAWKRLEYHLLIYEGKLLSSVPSVVAVGNLRWFLLTSSLTTGQSELEHLAYEAADVCDVNF